MEVALGVGMDIQGLLRSILSRGLENLCSLLFLARPTFLYNSMNPVVLASLPGFLLSPKMLKGRQSRRLSGVQAEAL